jgi:iron complex transport system substrate-binding protein
MALRSIKKRPGVLRHTLPRIALLAVITVLVGNAALAESSPQRVVSLDYCADQYVLKMLPPSQILAVSPDADKHFSYMREEATGIPQVRPLAENILSIQPDLVVRSYGGGPRVGNFLNRAGIEVLQLPYTNNLAEIRTAIQMIASRLGVPDRGVEMVEEMDLRLAHLKSKNLAKDTPRKALYMTPTGVTSGPGTLIHEMLLAAGLQNFEQQTGWRSLPLERLAYEQPDIIAAAFFDENTIQPALWSPMRHPIAKQQLPDRPTVMLQGAWTSCGAWFLLDAIEALAAK